MKKKQYSRVNTFTHRPSITQIASYLIFLAQIIIFFTIVQSNIQSQKSWIILLTLYIISIVLLIITTLLCSCNDPTDELIIQSQQQVIKYRENNEVLYCNWCKSYVKYKSRHCRVCQRCVQIFDHHCIWINNCIGIKNYNVFTFMIGCTFFNLNVFLISVIILTNQYKFQQFLIQFIISWIIAGIIAILLFLITNLILLHLYLNYRGITTFQFIMAQRQQKAKEQQKQIKNNQKSKQIPIKDSSQGSSNINNTVTNPNGIKNQIIFVQAHSEIQDQVSQGQLRTNHNKSSAKNQQDDKISNLSQLFTKNKSINFMLGNIVAEKPSINGPTQLYHSQNNQNLNSKNPIFKRRKSNPIIDKTK